LVRIGVGREKLNELINRDKAGSTSSGSATRGGKNSTIAMFIAQEIGDDRKSLSNTSAKWERTLNANRVVEDKAVSSVGSWMLR
jgi:DNA polymerase sigma